MSGNMQLPTRGQPTLYPFDSYELWLAVAVSAQLHDGTELTVRPDQVASNLHITLQSDLGHLNMAPPTWIDPAQVQAAGDPLQFLYVFGLEFQRPYYLQGLAVLLVLLIGMSGSLAVFLRPINDLFLGVGGLILGVWGIRAIVIQSPMPSVTAMDLALSGIIVALLLGVAIRTALHFHRQAPLPLPRINRRR
jgi:hypothetical protein